MRKNGFSILLILLGSLLVFGCSSSGGGGGGGQAAVNAILTGGGLGGELGGTGGAGNSIEFYMWYGTGGDVVVTASGTADATFTPSNITPYYGVNALTLNADTTIENTPAVAPSTGVVYIATDNNMYVSDGDVDFGNLDPDELPVTGLLITGTATVTFGVGGDANITLNLSNDFVNDGTVTTADQAATDRGSLTINPASFINYGTISLNATTAGQNGGSLNVDADAASFINQGTINTYGGDAVSADAGDGGYINVLGEHYVENTGPINSYGGAATGSSGMGGDGGYVYLEADYYGDTRNSATINTYGGNGITGGGSGGYFQLYVEYSGDCVNSGTLNTWGGDTVTGTAGNGGYVDYDTWQGGARHNAPVNAYGGNATGASGDAGNGGYFDIGVWSGSSWEPTPGDYTPTKDIEVSGNIDLQGGDALATGDGDGGDGGYFYVTIDGDYFPLGQQIRLLGYTLLDTRGGDGNFGGDGGYVYGWHEYSEDESGYFNPGGYYIDGADIDTRGGNAVSGAGITPAYGGNGGYVEFDMTTYGYVNGTLVDYDPNRFYMRGNIDTSGGQSLESDASGYNDAGYVYVYGQSGIEIQGTITARGGNDVGGSDGYGGDGGYVSLMADYGDVIVSGTIDMSGGDGADTGGNAGYTGDPTLATSQGYISCGDIFANGGNADETLIGSVGGDGQDFWLFAPMSTSHGALVAGGGMGDTPGSDGVIIADGHIIAP